MLKTNVFYGLHRSFERVDVMKGCDRFKPYFKTRCFSRQTEHEEKEFNFKYSFEPKRSTSLTRLYIQLTQKMTRRIYSVYTTALKVQHVPN